jgi:hypothetical protein
MKGGDHAWAPAIPVSLVPYVTFRDR